MTASDFDPYNFGREYQKAPCLFHFQFTNTKYVYRYELVEQIETHQINARNKQKKDELDLTQEQIWSKYGRSTINRK